MKTKLSSPALIDEFLFAVNKVNYNQSNEINALAGMGKDILDSNLFE